mgnify:CR=1 FL=1
MVGARGVAGEPLSRLFKISTRSYPASWRRTHLNTRLTPSATSTLRPFPAALRTTEI